ncbi:MAG: hypothetical protein OXK81_14165 [Chloroflexota bacterium]|nr:hypothetical protein [Chloroflexota bacterium]
MKIETAWVKPPRQIRGLDHLAVQAPCINVYGRLLPGITNVTDRARYYSFYPWLIWAFDRRGWTRYDDKFVERFRRADCLFSMISLRHALVSGGDYNDHARAMIGSDTLGPVVRELKSSTSLTISDYSKRTGAKARYFANKLGGLGQYYLGVLRELAILSGDSRSGLKYTRQRGQLIAERLDHGFEGKVFMDIVEADNLSTRDLDDLKSLCPCHLQENREEADILRDLFFARGIFQDSEAMPRRRSLQSIIQLSDLLVAEGSELTEDTFRACAYSRALPSGTPWEAPGSLITNRERWATYARNELLSLAVQGLFFALLDAYEESGLRLDSSDDIVDWFLRQPETLGAIKELGGNKNYKQLVEDSESWLSILTNWTSSEHEVQMTERIVELCRGPRSADCRQQIILFGIRALIALGARRTAGHFGYANLDFEEGYFRYYPINLRSFEYRATQDWVLLAGTELLRWILLHWGIEVHLRVALRKLRGQSQSTYRIRPSDQGFEVVGVPPATHTSPRFDQAVGILKDIGALVRSESGTWVSSELGREIIEQGDVA